jgi:prepilin-type N-terminal cleavage/methylation domain-containing protein
MSACGSRCAAPDVRPRAAGFSLLELAVVVVIVGILAGVVLERLLPLIGRAERASFLQVQADLQSALLLEAAELITSGRTDRLAELASGNPMRLFLTPPANYAGELRAGEVANAPRATWYYDEAGGRLAYRVGGHTLFDPLGGARDRVEFRVALVYDGGDGAGLDHDRFAGLRLEATRPFRWPE